MRALSLRDSLVIKWQLSLLGCATVDTLLNPAELECSRLLNGDNGGFLGELCTCAVRGRARRPPVLGMCQLLLSCVIFITALREGGTVSVLPKGNPRFRAWSCLSLYTATKWWSWDQKPGVIACVSLNTFLNLLRPQLLLCKMRTILPCACVCGRVYGPVR